MALIHEKLYQSDNMANINFKEYVNTLIINLYNSYCVDSSIIKVECDIEDISFNIDTAIPLGLIINELISNSFKHAFPNKRHGQINLKIIHKQDNYYEMVVNDNGIGFDKIDLNNIKTLGMNLVNALVDQIDGDLIIKGENGSSFTITFIYN